jgi:hypothetical protein
LQPISYDAVGGRIIPWGSGFFTAFDHWDNDARRYQAKGLDPGDRGCIGINYFYFVSAAAPPFLVCASDL